MILISSQQKIFVVKLLVILCLILIVIIPPSRAFNKKNEKHWLPEWKQLILEGEKPLTRFLVRLRIEDESSLLPYPLREIGRDEFKSFGSSKNILLLSAETVTMSLVLPQEKYEHFVWFRAEDMKAIQRVRWKKSGNKWLKLYRWKDKGVFRLTLKPRKGREDALGPGKWTKHYSSFYEYQLENPKEAEKIVSEPLCLIYQVMRLAHQGLKSKVSMLVFGKKTMHTVTVSFKKKKVIKIRFNEDSSNGFISKMKKTAVFVYKICARPVAGTKHHETFSLVGLNHNIEIFVEPKSGIITRIRGDNDVVGHVDLRLVSVVKRR